MTLLKRYGWCIALGGLIGIAAFLGLGKLIEGNRDKYFQQRMRVETEQIVRAFQNGQESAISEEICDPKQLSERARSLDLDKLPSSFTIYNWSLSDGYGSTQVLFSDGHRLYFDFVWIPNFRLVNLTRGKPGLLTQDETENGESQTE